MGKADDDYKREIVMRAVADSAWSFIASCPIDITVLISQGVVTVDVLSEYWKEELEKLV